MCIDFRKLNQSTKKDAIPLPLTDDLLEALGGAQWFSSLDYGFEVLAIAGERRGWNMFVKPESVVFLVKANIVSSWSIVREKYSIVSSGFLKFAVTK